MVDAIVVTTIVGTSLFTKEKPGVDIIILSLAIRLSRKLNVNTISTSEPSILTLVGVMVATLFVAEMMAPPANG
jgi:hypothetical protein